MGKSEKKAGKMRKMVKTAMKIKNMRKMLQKILPI